MKNIFFFLLILFASYGCSTDSDDTDVESQDFTVALNVHPNHSFGTYTESAYAFLSDKNGTILDTAEMQIGQTTTLSYSGDPSAVYDLSYMYYADLDFVGEESYSLVTFTNIDQGDYTIGPRSSIVNTNNEIYLNLGNTGYPCKMTSPNPGNGTFGPEDGGYYKFSGNLVDSPISDFYISFKSPNDQFERYFWEEDIAEGSVFNIDYNTLPEIQNNVIVETPSNDMYNFRLEGLIDGDDQHIRHSIKEGNYPEGLTSILIPIPSNIFNSYLFNVSFRNDDFQYFKTLRTAIIPTIIDAPDLSFTVNSQSAANFDMTTNGDGVMYYVIFRGLNASETVSVSHSIYGEITPEISFSIENLRLNMQLTYPELTGFETLPLGSVTLMNYTEIDSYRDILEYKIQGKDNEIPENGFNEGVGQQFD